VRLVGARRREGKQGGKGDEEEGERLHRGKCIVVFPEPSAQSTFAVT
jgi:hypothetical protein